jgi:hypothetical protein
MHRMPILALVLALVLAIAAGAAPAHASMARSADYCGAGYDRCMQTCNMSIWTAAPPPWPPGRCNDYCARGTNICEAGRIPHLGYHARHH